MSINHQLKCDNQNHYGCLSDANIGEIMLVCARAVPINMCALLVTPVVKQRQDFHIYNVTVSFLVPDIWDVPSF